MSIFTVISIRITVSYVVIQVLSSESSYNVTCPVIILYCQRIPMGIPGEENPRETPGYSTERKGAVLNKEAVLKKVLPPNLHAILQVVWKR